MCGGTPTAFAHGDVIVPVTAATGHWAPLVGEFRFRPITFNHDRFWPLPLCLFLFLCCFSVSLVLFSELTCFYSERILPRIPHPQESPSFKTKQNKTKQNKTIQIHHVIIDMLT